MKHHFCASDEAFADLEKRLCALLPVAEGDAYEEGELVVFTPMSDYLRQTNVRELPLRIRGFLEPMQGSAVYDLLARGDAFQRETARSVDDETMYRVALLDRTQLNLC